MKIHARHPSGAIVEFDEESHTYRVLETDDYLQSATTFIGVFFPKFDVDKVAPRCVGKPKYRGMTEQEIRAAWAAEALRGRTEGTNVHRYAECLLTGDFKNLPTAGNEREQNLFGQVTEAVLRLEERFVFIASEIIVFSPFYSTAGTIDLLMYDPAANDLVIIDWKQNKEIKDENPWEDAYPPISHMEACELNKYRLQLNLYEFILRNEKYPGFENIPPATGIRKALIHLTENGFRSIQIENYQTEIKYMLEDIPF